MINNYLTTMEIAEELCLDVETAKDLIDGKGEWQTEDISRLLGCLAKKLAV
jgi:orotate phosphoribosyltransferase-like protein